ncbi:MAG: sigma factor, partial [Bacteroidota bacterium]
MRNLSITRQHERSKTFNLHVTFRTYLSSPDRLDQMNLLEDHNLMLKVKEGDVEKLNLLYHRYSRRFFGFFYGMTHDGATSEDLVQNVFMRILKYKHTYKENGDFEVWAF